MYRKYIILKKKIKVSSRKCKLVADIGMQKYRNNEYQMIITQKRIIISKTSGK